MESSHNLLNDLKSYRILQKMTQLEFAQAVGISKSTLQEIEYGKRPNLDPVQCISQHLGVPLPVLLSGSVPPTQSEVITQLSRDFDRFARCSEAAQVELLHSTLHISQSPSVIKEEHGDG